MATFLATRNGNGKAPTSPRKVTKGTTYEATGMAAAPQLDYEAGSSQGTVIREVVPELLSPATRLAAYGRMMNDAGVDVSMRAAKTPILGAEFYVDPYDDLPINQEIAQFVEANLMEGMTSPFLNTLEDILHYYEDGYAILEKVYENREWTPKGTGRNTKNYTMLKKLGVRPSSTIKSIDYDDNGGPTGVTQTAIRAGGKTEDVAIDISKLMIFTFSRKGGDLTGKSLLRTAYPHWYYKTHFYKIDAVQKERHGLGVPHGKLLPGWTEKDREILRTLLRNFRANEESFLITTPGVDVEFAELKGNLVNVLESATHHNMMILLNVMAQFMNLGVETSGGGRATAGSQIDMFMKSLRYVANYITDIYNMYVIPELVVYNYKSTSFPKLKVRNIGETKDLQMLGSAIANLFSQEAITGDDPTENWIRQVFDMPKRDPSTTRTPVGSKSDTQPTPDGPQPAQKGGVKPQRDSGGNTGKSPSSAN